MAKEQDNLGRLDENTKDEIVKHVKDEIEKSQNVLNPWKNRLIKYNDLYRMIQTKKHYEGLSNIFVPEILRAVETITSNLYKAIVRDNNWFEYAGREKDDESGALAMTLLARYQMDENNFKAHLKDSLRQMVISGVTVRKVLWDFKQVARKRKSRKVEEAIDPITKKALKSAKVNEESFVETTKDHWTFEPVDLLGFHISDPTTPYNDIQKARWIGQEYYVDDPWLKDKASKKWINEAAYKDLKENIHNKKTVDSQYKQLADNRSRENYTMADKTGTHIIEMWGLCKAKWVHSEDELKEMGLSGEDYVESVIILGNKCELLKVSANPFWHGQKPFVSCPYIPQENDFAGMGVAQVGEKLQEELNDTRNQTMDNKTLILMNMWLKSKGSGISNKQLRIRPNGVIDTNDMNGLKPLAPPLLAGVGVNIEGVVKEDLRQATGAASNLQGIAQAGVDTATESSIVNTQSFGRLAHVAEMYSELVLKPVLIFAEYLNYQFYDREKMVRVIGEQGVKFKKLNPDEIVGYKDVIIRLATDNGDNPAVMRQQFMQFATMIQQMPPELIQYHWKMLDKMYKGFFPNGTLADLYPEPSWAEELLTPDEEFELLKQAHMVHPKQGDNHQAHLEQHLKDFEMTKYGLAQDAYEMFKAHIMETQSVIQQQLEAEQQQMMESLMAQQPEAGGQEKLNTGQAKNMSAFTQTNKPSGSDLTKTLGA